MHKTLLFIACLLVAKLVSTQENKTIKEVLQQLKTFNERESPSDTTLPQFPLGRFREEDFIRKGTFYEKQFNQLSSINQSLLTPADKVNLELLKYSLADEIISFKYKAYLNPILSDEGFHTSLPRLANRTLTNEKEVRAYLNVLKAIPVYIE